MKRVILVLVLIGGTVSCTSTKRPLSVSPSSDKIMYEGRMGETEDGAKEIYWSGTSISLNFKGTGIRAKMNDKTGDNYYNIIADGEIVDTLRPGTEARLYELASGLEDTKHTVEIFKRTEYDRGLAWFYGFELPAGAEVLDRDAPKTYKIEYFGDSITAGYSVNDYTTDRPDSIYTDYYLSYGNLVAQHFDAEQHCTCKSGIGITVSWFDYEMPDVWDLSNPFDSTSTWDFSKYQPDLVVVNLFQNDSWITTMNDHESFKRNFGTIPPSKEEIIQAYADFVSEVRATYPDADIIATLGNMDITREGSPWPGYVEDAIASLNDDKIHTVFTPYKETPGHPKIEEQEIIAENLISFIEENLGWQSK